MAQLAAHSGLSRKQEAAVTALLTARTAAIAANTAGVSTSTLWRWLREDAFQARYKAAKRQMLDSAINRLREISSDAVETLRDVCMDSKAHPSSRVQAAGKILEIALRAVELEDISARLDALEAAEVTE